MYVPTFLNMISRNKDIRDHLKCCWFFISYSYCRYSKTVTQNKIFVESKFCYIKSFCVYTKINRGFSSEHTLDHGLINYKGTATIWRLYWSLIEFIDWRYNQSCWYFDPALWTIAPVRHRPEQNRVTWETLSSEAFTLLQEPVGVLASYVPTRKCRYEANKCGWTQPLFRAGHDRRINKRSKLRRFKTNY